VKADEKAPPAPKTVTEAAEAGTQRDLLVAMRARIAKTVEDPKCPPRDLASLSRRLIEIAREIEAIDLQSGRGEGSVVANTDDEAWDSSAI